MLAIAHIEECIYGIENDICNYNSEYNFNVFFLLVVDLFRF